MLGFLGVDVLVEVKRPGEKPRPTQEAWHQRWRGARVRVCRTRDDIQEVLDWCRGRHRASRDYDANH